MAHQLSPRILRSIGKLEFDRLSFSVDMRLPEGRVEAAWYASDDDAMLAVTIFNGASEDWGYRIYRRTAELTWKPVHAAGGFDGFDKVEPAICDDVQALRAEPPASPPSSTRN